MQWMCCNFSLNLYSSSVITNMLAGKRNFCKIVRWLLMCGESNLMTINMETAEALNELDFKGKACFQSLTRFDKSEEQPRMKTK